MKYRNFLGLATAVFSSTISLAGTYGKVMCVGDSLTGGGGAVFAYRGALYDDLVANGDSFHMVGPIDWGSFPDETGHNNVHAGFGGWSADQLAHGAAPFPEDGSLPVWLSSYTPDTIVLMAGTNDYYDIMAGSGQSAFDSAVQSYETTLMTARYGTLMDDIFAANPNMRVVLCAPPKVPGKGVGSDEWDVVNGLEPIASNVAASYKAQGRNVNFVDLWTPTSDTVGVYTQLDGIHWNTAGGKLSGDLIYRGLATVPEPFSLTVLGFGGLALLRRRRMN